MREFFSLALLREKVTDEKKNNFLRPGIRLKNRTNNTQQQQQQHGLKKTRTNPRDSGFFSL
tara:strand:- start:260 stop:442 length:183 start_codon:yes stop_codon:yes gene_type:complete